MPQNELKELWSQLYEAQIKKYPAVFHYEYRSLFYLGSDGKPHHANISQRAPQYWTVPQMRECAQNHSPLSWLENETRIMARATGFPQLSLVQFVLTGTKPVLPRYWVRGHSDYASLPSGEQMQPIYIRIEISARDLTFEELRRIYNGYREILQLKKHKLREGKELAKSHWELYQLVRAKGGPPERKKVVFWESVKGAWNNSHPRDEYKTWKGVKLAYDRAITQLENRVTGKGGTP
jgi:hypothetical protein